MRRLPLMSAALLLVVAPAGCDGDATRPPRGVDVVEPAPGQAASGGVMPFDFDGDGYADLTVGVPGEDLHGVKDAGAVQVLYGSASGPTTRDQLWHQGRRGVKGALERGDQFGDVLASGDFDADGYADLAIGIPGEDIGRTQDAGAVQVLFGGPGALTARNQVWHQATRGVPGRNEAGDRFGETLAAGDVDGDGFADLVVGVPSEDLGVVESAGSLVVLRGSASGLTATGAQAWNERSAGIASSPRARGQFGRDVAVGDVTGDGRADLVVSSPGDWDGQGAIHLLRGDTAGLTAADSQYITMTSLTMAWGPSSVWLGDVNADGHADLALAAAGVALLHGHDDGLHPGPLQPPGTPGADVVWRYDEATSTDYLGPAVTGDVTGDGFADVVMSISQGQGDTGVVIALGTSEGIGSEQQEWMWWGHALNLLALSGGTTMWPVFGGSGAEGSVTTIEWTPPGTGGTAIVWSQDTPGIEGADEPGDGFGRSVG